jgi:hypothetical protein
MFLTMAHYNVYNYSFGLFPSSKFKKMRRFGSWILLQSSGKKGGRGQKTYLLGPFVELV